MAKGRRPGARPRGAGPTKPGEKRPRPNNPRAAARDPAAPPAAASPAPPPAPVAAAPPPASARPTLIGSPPPPVQRAPSPAPSSPAAPAAAPPRAPSSPAPSPSVSPAPREGVVRPSPPAPRSSGRRATAIAGALGVVVAVGAVVLLRHRGGARPRANAAPPRGAAPRPDAAPYAPPPAIAYVGSAACKECHTEKYAAWQRDWHARALAPATKRSVVGDFADRHFAGTSTEAWMRRDGAAYVMRTRGATGEVADFRVSYVIGGKRMQDALTVTPDGRWQVLPVYFHVTGRQWVDYTEDKQGALTPDHPFFWTNARRMANHECLDCHTTGLAAARDEATGAWTTGFADGTVACESCHGPGGKHADSQDAADILHPGKDAALGFEACGRCHGPRQPLFPLLDIDHRFELRRDRYDDYYDPIVVTLPDGVSPEFFADGKPRSSSFEYQAVLQSACYRKGKATCLACHTAPHEPHRGADLVGTKVDDACAGCHHQIARGAAAHSHHRSAAAQSCVACHMPPIVSGVLDHFADHAIDVPVPENTERHGIPSACGTCHADRSPAALQADLVAWWPGAPARQARRRRLADAFDEATAGTSAPPLAAVIADPDEAPTLRGAAAVVLARRFRGQAASAVAPLLGEPSPLLRAKGCEALGAGRIAASGDAVAAMLADPALRVRLACALALVDMGDARGEDALRALAEDPATAHLMIPHSELGVRYANRRAWADARRELSATVRMAPAFPVALVQLAEVAAEQGDFAEARAQLDQVLVMEPANPSALALRGRLPAAAP